MIGRMARSISSSVMRPLPSMAAVISSLAESKPGFGISTLDWHFTPATWSLLAPQSVTTMPSKPHSSLKMSTKRCLFSLAYSPLTSL